MSTASRGWCMPGYIALGVRREPLDQTDLSNSPDASSKVVGDHHMKLADRWDQGARRRHLQAGRPHLSGGGPPLQ